MQATTFTATSQDGTTSDFVLIDLGDGNFQSMLKADYDKLSSNSSTPQAGE